MLTPIYRAKRADVTRVPGAIPLSLGITYLSIHRPQMHHVFPRYEMNCSILHDKSACVR